MKKLIIGIIIVLLAFALFNTNLIYRGYRKFMNYLAHGEYKTNAEIQSPSSAPSKPETGRTVISNDLQVEVTETYNPETGETEIRIRSVR